MRLFCLFLLMLMIGLSCKSGQIADLSSNAAQAETKNVETFVREFQPLMLRIHQAYLALFQSRTDNEPEQVIRARLSEVEAHWRTLYTLGDQSIEQRRANIKELHRIYGLATDDARVAQLAQLPATFIGIPPIIEPPKAPPPPPVPNGQPAQPPQSDPRDPADDKKPKPWGFPTTEEWLLWLAALYAAKKAKDKVDEYRDGKKEEQQTADMQREQRLRQTIQQEIHAKTHSNRLTVTAGASGEHALPRT